MLYLIFQYGWKQVLIQRILIGFEAILEKKYLSGGFTESRDNFKNSGAFARTKIEYMHTFPEK